MAFNSFAGFHALKIAGSHSNSMSNQVSYVWWRGLDSARDIGWRAAAASYVVMLDSGVLTEPRFFSKATVTVETDLGAGALGAKLKPVTMENGWQAL